MVDFLPVAGAKVCAGRATDFQAEFLRLVQHPVIEAVSLAGNENDVFSLVRCVAKVRATDRRIAMDLHHYFRFQDGKVAYYRGTEDTAQVEAVLQA